MATHSSDESEPLKGEDHADHTDTAPSAAKQNCLEPAVQDSPSSQSAPASKACSREEIEERASTTSAHLEDGAEASCDSTAAPDAAAAADALSACSLAQSPETGPAPSGSSAAKSSDVESSAQHADAIFLKNLFCCPITQVSHPPSCSRPCTTGSLTDARKHVPCWLPPVMGTCHSSIFVHIFAKSIWHYQPASYVVHSPTFCLCTHPTSSHACCRA